MNKKNEEYRALLMFLNKMTIISLYFIPKIGRINVKNSNDSIIAIKVFEIFDASKTNNMLTSKPVNKDDIYMKIKSIVMNDLHLGIIEIFFSLKDLKVKVSEIKANITLISLIVFGFGFLATFGISTFITKPFNRLVNTFETIAARNLNNRADVKGKSEFAL